jgi:hypothetical protein
MGAQGAARLTTGVAMTRAKLLFFLALVAHALGWVLPVIDDGERVYRGVHAFRVALSPLWPYEQFHIPTGYRLWLSIASALTNVAFVVLAAYLWPWVARSAGNRLAVFVLGGATLLNLHWPITLRASPIELGVGYYVWIVSFVLLLLAVHPVLAGRRRQGGPYGSGDLT